MVAVDEAGKQAYLDRLQQFKSPDEVAAFEASGEATAMRQSLMAASRGAIRPAAEARGQYLTGVQRGTEQFGWQKAGESRAVDQNVRAQETAAQAALLAPLTREATVASTAVSNQQVATGQQGILRSEQEIRESKQRIDASKLNEDRLRTEQYNKEFTRRSEAYTGTVAKLSANAQGVVGTPDGIKSLTDSLSKVIKDPKGLTDAVAFVTAAMNSNPDFARLPTDVVESLVLSKADQFGTTFGDWDGTLINHIKNGMTAALKTSAPRMLANETQKAALTELAQRQKILMSQAEMQAYPELATMLDARAKEAGAGGAAPAAPGVPAAPVPAAPSKDALMLRQVELEKEEIAAGVRKEPSSEVAKFMKDQTKTDRAAIKAASAASLSSATNLGNAFNDIVTLPVRGAMGVANTVLRLPNAFGAGIPYFPDEYVGSMTPYSDAQRRKDGGEFTKADLAARRKKLEEELAAARK